jgi:glycosyltransferase involved in cell wall biosynthesis
MVKFTLGVFLDDDLASGGSFQQSFNNVILANMLATPQLDVKIITTQKKNLKLLKDLNMHSFLYKTNIFSRKWMQICENIPLNFYHYIRLLEKKNHFERFLKKLNIDLIYFVSQSEFVNFLHSTNFIYTLFDLCHRDFPEFPEVANNRIFERREKILSKNLIRSVAILVESELGKKNLITKYQIDPERVYVCPFNYSQIIDKTYIENKQSINPKNYNIKKKYKLNCDYLFYPAQFWPHKNHKYILEALYVLEKKENILIGAIFSGSDKGNLSYIKKIAEKLNLHGRVKFVGFVPNEEIPYLYQQSLALVMPTYFGPTNLPPLEAFKYNVPVLYSDLPGLKEQVGEAALMLNLNKPESLSTHIKNLLNSDKLRKDLIQKGNAMLNNSNPIKSNITILAKIVENFKVKRSCWL